MATMQTATARPTRTWWLLALLAFAALLGACSDSPPAQPTISAQPNDTSVVAGNAATLSVSASGPDIVYQWQLSTDGGTTWGNVAGATSAIYTTPATSIADGGRRYRVVVTAAGISINSSAVTLTVTAAVLAPSIGVAPAAISVAAPTAAVFNVTVAGTAPAYQWQRSTDGGSAWSAIAGATGASYDTGATDVSMTGHQFRVQVSNSAGSVTSAAVTLTVNAAQAMPTFTQQPTDRSVVEGTAVAFSVAATGTPAPTLQWQMRTNPNVVWGDLTINGVAQTDAILNIAATTLAQSGFQFRVLATNGVGVANSTVVTLTVTAATLAPAITTQPTAQSVTAPATATFSAAASGTPTPTWQWQLSSDGGTSFSNVNGATSATYTTPATSTADSGKRYRAVATNSAGSATTNAVALTVTAPAAGWQSALALRGADAFTASRAVVAAGAAGQFVAAWLDTDGAGAHELRASRYTPGQGWSAAAPVASVTSTSGATMRHAIAMDPAGNAVVVFTSLSNTRQSLWASRQEPTGPWSAPVLIESQDDGHAELPALAIDALGSATAVWQQNDTVFFPNMLSTRRIVASRFVVGQGWSAPVDIDFVAGANGTGLNIHVGASPSGEVVAAWTTATPAGQVAAANVLRVGTGWVGAQQLVADPTPTTASVVGGAAINDAGLALVTFRRLPSTTSNVFAARYTPATGWASPELLGANGDAAAVVLGPDGTATVAWENSPAGNQVLVTRAPAGGAWSAPQVVGGGFGPGIGRDASGHVTLAWVSASQPRTMLSARWPAAGAPSAAVVIESATAIPSTFAGGGLAVSANGHAAAVWIEGDAPNAVPWANVFR